MKAVLFDFGNVLYRVDYPSMAERIAPGRGAELCRAFVGSSVQVAYETGAAGLDEVLAELSRAGYDVSRAAFLEAYLDVFAPVAGMRALVEGLAGKVRLGLLSNTSPEHARLFIERTPEARLLGPRVYSFELGCMKPDPRLYREAAGRLDVEPHEILYVDDVPAFAEGAGRCGMRGVVFGSAEALRAELEELGVTLGGSPA